MATVNCYLNFNGTCEAAFNFYKSVFGGEFSYIGRYKEMPGEQALPASEQNKIMHVSLPISKETALFGSDTLEHFGGLVKVGDNISISITADTEDQAKHLFNALSAGGNVSMPLEKTFWGALFGTFVDKFGINWMVNYDYDQNKKQ